MAFTHGVTTCYAFSVKKDDLLRGYTSHYGVKYRCLEFDIPRASGISQCSPQKLCSKDWLFTNPDREGTSHPYGGYLLLLLCSSITLIFIPLLLMLTILLRYCLGESVSSIQMEWKILSEREKAFVLPLLGAMLFGLYFMWAIPFCTGVFQFRRDEWPHLNREGPITFDVDCQAVHVALSPWAYYLDVGQVNRAFRIARMWFNA